MKIYRGIRTPDGCIVTIDGRPLEPRLDLANHSPTGFEWGYEGSGPAQLALAILADALGAAWALDPATHYQAFKRDVIARLPHAGWTLTGDDIAAWLAAQPAARSPAEGVCPTCAGKTFDGRCALCPPPTAADWRREAQGR